MSLGCCVARGKPAGGEGAEQGTHAGPERRPEPAEPAKAAQPARPTERTEAGEQRVLPGAERISDAEFAKRRAGEPLKPTVEQKAGDRRTIRRMS
jgi:hypothetical protein